MIALMAAGVLAVGALVAVIVERKTGSSDAALLWLFTVVAIGAAGVGFALIAGAGR